MLQHSCIIWILRCHARRGEIAAAAERAEDIAEMLERAFGWDCILVAEARREVRRREFIVLHCIEVDVWIIGY
jgi:hypothetical protein